ncbi:Pycsar system effector family protein [Erythrobacter sp. Alg231-14]|uniref:Pycsar system effector family protein n=1 Tax=Erythrobacter sp. Alg231-14 TaxID=1922225 RepID=UPI00307CBA2A
MKQAEAENAAKDCEPEVQSEGDTASARTFSPQSIHLVRTAQMNTLTLSQMADQKASILIGATFVVFSLAVTRLIGSEINVSTLSLAATAFLSSLCAVMAVLPSLGKPPRDPKAFNPLFFGHFAAISEDEWTETLMDQFATDETLFRTMLKDIHQNGQVLYNRKYRFLSYAYRIFLGGLAITMTIYCVEMLAF